MSNTGRDGNLIPDDLQENYEQIRVAQGLSWSDMAEQFEHDASPSLAAWARARAAGVGAGPTVRYVEDGTGAPVGVAGPAGRRSGGRRRAVPARKQTAAPAPAAGVVEDLTVPEAVPVPAGADAAADGALTDDASAAADDGQEG